MDMKSMDMKSIEELCNKTCKELEPISRKKEFTPGDYQMIHMATDIIKNILKIEKLLVEIGENGYSRDGKWDAQMTGSYGDGSSYANRGMHYVRGHYSRDDGGSAYGYSRNGSYDYSRNSSKMSVLEEMMHNASDDREREAIRRCISEMNCK